MNKIMKNIFQQHGENVVLIKWQIKIKLEYFRNKKCFFRKEWKQNDVFVNDVWLYPQWGGASSRGQRRAERPILKLHHRPAGGGANGTPLLGLHRRSMPCLISTIRASSVNDSVILKLHSGLTSKKVTPSFSAYTCACSVVTWRL